MDRITKKDKKVLGDPDLMLKERFVDGVSDPLLRREMKRFSFEHKGLNFIDFRQMILKWTENESVATIKCMSADNDDEAVTSRKFQQNIWQVSLKQMGLVQLVDRKSCLIYCRNNKKCWKNNKIS